MARIGIARLGGAASAGPCTRAPAGGSGGAGGIASQFNGIAATRLSAAQIRHASRQPKASSNHAEAGQPSVLANPAIRVMPVIGARAPWPYRRVNVAKAGS